MTGFEWTAVTVASIGVAVIIYFMAIAVGEERKIRRERREAERFQRSPRIGDKAGYELTSGQWMVGEITRVGNWIDYMNAKVVDLRVSRMTAMGERQITDTWSVLNLRWFPPSTPLGVVTIDEMKDGRQ